MPTSKPMALMPAPHPPVISLLLCLLFSATHHYSSASAAQQSPLLLPLTHALSKSHNTTIHHLLKSSTLRSASRFRAHRRRLLGSRTTSQVSLPLSPGSDYTLSLSIGATKPETVELFMDTGSDLVWLPCAPFQCILCDGKPAADPLSVASAHSAVGCSSPSCSAAHGNMPSSDLCAISGCPLDDLETSGCSSSKYSCPPFYYAYGDGSLVARLRRAHLAVEGVVGGGKQSNKPALQLADFTFGCAHSTLAEPVGVAGFGQGVLSLPAQLAKMSPGLGRHFSYCLISHSFQSQQLRRPSPLILGRDSFEDDGAAPTASSSSPSSSPVVYTPLLDNPKHPYFYTVGLDAISVGTRRIPSTPGLSTVDRRGNGGFVVDSGTTFTMLPTEMHALVAAAFDRTMKAAGYRRAPQAEQTTGLFPCFHHHQQQRGNGSDEAVMMAAVPSLTLHLSGNASVTLPRRNYYVGFPAAGAGRDVGCLMLMGIAGDDSDSGGGPMGTFGNVQQQGFEVVFDLERRRVGFARKKCASLWDTLSRG